MIRIHGDESPEGRAACKLGDLIVRAWPWIETDAQAQIDVVAGVKCHGQSTRDLDLVVLAYLPPRARFIPFLNFRRPYDGQWLRPAAVRVQSLCLVLELKESDPGDVRFLGTRVEVFYRNKSRPHWSQTSLCIERLSRQSRTRGTVGDEPYLAVASAARQTADEAA